MVVTTMHIRATKIFLVLLGLMAVGSCDMSEEPADARQTTREQRFVELALQCLHREYPNQISHQVSSAGQMAEPSELHPAFYGCFDWHSSVHGHWLLVRLLRLDSPGLDRKRIIAALEESFTDANIRGEVEYFEGEGRTAYERPYGRAWLLQLTAELREWDDDRSRHWLATLQPLEQLIVEQMMAYLPNLVYPVRSGTHGQTAFSFGLMLDYARTANRSDFAALLEEKTRAFYLQDKFCPLDYEPSGADFLSPCLMEADLVRRILRPDAFAKWLNTFLPGIPRNGRGDWLAVGVVLDPTDGHLAHLDGVNLSRAWALENVAAGLPPSDERIPALQAAARVHAEAGLASVTGEHYAGGHWLASFATYLVTGRGAPDAVSRN
jgi:hypothetical protein